MPSYPADFSNKDGHRIYYHFDYAKIKFVNVSRTNALFRKTR